MISYLQCNRAVESEVFSHGWLILHNLVYLITDQPHCALYASSPIHSSPLLHITVAQLIVLKGPKVVLSQPCGCTPPMAPSAR